MAAHEEIRHPEDLAHHEIISYTYWSGRDEWFFIGPEEKTVTVRIQARIHANNGDTCRAAALADQGVILQPDFIVGDDLRRGDLVELLPTWRKQSIGIHAVYPTRKHLPLKTRRMVDFLIAAFKDRTWRWSSPCPTLAPPITGPYPPPCPPRATSACGQKRTMTNTCLNRGCAAGCHSITSYLL